jgi:hypothetical protein
VYPIPGDIYVYNGISACGTGLAHCCRRFTRAAMAAAPARKYLQGLLMVLLPAVVVMTSMERDSASGG